MSGLRSKIFAETLILETKLCRIGLMHCGWLSKQKTGPISEKSLRVFSKKVSISFQKKFFTRSETSLSFPRPTPPLLWPPCLRDKRVKRGEARVGITVRDGNKIINFKLISSRVTFQRSEITVETDEEMKKFTFIETD